MKRLTLTKAVIKRIHGAVDAIFDRAKARFLGRPPVDKRITIGFTPRVSLPSLFEAASMEERAKADQDILRGLMDIAEGFVESIRESTKSHTVKAVEGFLNEAYAKGVDTDVDTVLGGQLADVFRKAKEGMVRVFDTEASNARNTGSLDGIIKVNVANDIKDPVVYWVVVRDKSLCDECRRLHLMPNGDPRLWYLSEVGHGYHKKGQDAPKIGGLHPHCRCSLVTLLPGYGFKKGSIEFIALDHDEMKKQRG